MLQLKKYSAQPKITIKHILLSNQNWWNFYTQHKDNIRTGIVVGITKLLSCKNIIRGYPRVSGELSPLLKNITGVGEAKKYE